MKVKELKAILADADDNYDVFIADANQDIVQIVDASMSGDHESVYLFTRHEFPQAWFDTNGREYRWINGNGVRLQNEEIEDEVCLDFGNNDTRTVKLKLHDGYGEGDGVRVTYPKLADLTDEKIEEMDELLGRRISDSGFVGFDDLCVLYAKIETTDELEPETKPKIELTREMHLVCESIQEVTMRAWPKVWADNKYDQDSRVVLETLREWGVEFENWWLSHEGDWIDSHDYLEEIWAFTDNKCKQYLEQFQD